MVSPVFFLAHAGFRGDCVETIRMHPAQQELASAPSSLINGVVPVGWGEAHLSQIHVECLYNESLIAFHTQ